MAIEKTIVKVNEKNAISVARFEDGTYSIAHLVNGKYSETLISDPYETKYEDEKVEIVQDLAAQIIAAELAEFDLVLEADAQLIYEAFSYNVWIAVSYYDNKLSYSCSTIRNGSDEEHEDRNVVERKTFKGLANYLKRFDK